jgi:hypothetical protein
MRCNERLRSVTACAARRADPPTTDPFDRTFATQPTLAAVAELGVVRRRPRYA